MAYVVDRVVICDAFLEPDAHYELLPGGRSKRVEGRRPSMRFLASARDSRGGIAGVIGRQAGLFDDLSAAAGERNDFVNQLREEVRGWREAGYPGTAAVTRRLLEWWFERDEERKAIAKHFFFCQQEAVETVIYLYEVQGRRKMPETGDLLRYALKLATGTGKTVVMALFVTWATLHKRKVSGSSLSENFLVLVPNLTVRDRVSGQPRGDGLDSAGEHNLYDAFESGLVKVVRLPDPDQHGRVYLDLWDDVKGARTEVEYLRACRGAVWSIYSAGKKDYDEWSSTFEAMRPGPSPVLPCVADTGERAKRLSNT
jgi:type III restriction enzyme